MNFTVLQKEKKNIKLIEDAKKDQEKTEKEAYDAIKVYIKYAAANKDNLVDNQKKLSNTINTKRDDLMVINAYIKELQENIISKNAEIEGINKQVYLTDDDKIKIDELNKEIRLLNDLKIKEEKKKEELEKKIKKIDENLTTTTQLSNQITQSDNIKEQVKKDAQSNLTKAKNALELLTKINSLNITSIFSGIINTVKDLNLEKYADDAVKTATSLEKEEALKIKEDIKNELRVFNTNSNKRTNQVYFDDIKSKLQPIEKEFKEIIIVLIADLNIISYTVNLNSINDKIISLYDLLTTQPPPPGTPQAPGTQPPPGTPPPPPGTPGTQPPAQPNKEGEGEEGEEEVKVKPIETLYSKIIAGNVNIRENIDNYINEVKNLLNINDELSELSSSVSSPVSSPVSSVSTQSTLASLSLSEDDDILRLAQMTGGNNIDIKYTYELYYSKNTDDLIIELLKILKTSENVIYFLLIINTSLSKLLKDLNKILINFYNNDVLLSYSYDENEIIYYIFLNYIYNNYKSLLEFPNKDIIINIGKGNIRTKENYREIYKKLDIIFKNPEIISKLIIFIKKHIELPKTIKHPEKTKDTEYLLLFIYKYSKKEEKTIKGYDSFLTFIYLNILNKLNNVRINNIKLDNLPTLNLYNFNNLKKNFNFELTSNQEKVCIKLIKNIKLLIALISDRYNYIEHKNIIKSKLTLTLNDEIIDYLNIFGKDAIFKNYKTMPIMDLWTLNKNIKIDIDNLRDLRKLSNEDKIYNILSLAAYIYKDAKEISVEIYCKLVKYYFITRTNKRLNDLVYEMIFNMNSRIDKTDIQRKLIEELSLFKLDLSEIIKFINPVDKKFNINDLLKQINFTDYIKDDISLIIPYLLNFYNNDNNQQYIIQDILCKKLLINKKQLLYGGTGEIQKFNKTDDLIDTLLNDDVIKELDKNENKIEAIFKSIKSISDIDLDFINIIKISINNNDIITYTDYLNKFSELSNNLITNCANNSSECMTYKKTLENKKKEVEYYDKNILSKYIDFIEKTDNEIKFLYEPFIFFFDRINDQKEMHENPFIREIYTKYIENDNDNPKYDIDILIKSYKDVFNGYKRMITDIENKLSSVIVKLDEIINKKDKTTGGGENKNKINKVIKMNYINKITSGGNSGLNNYDELNSKIETKNAQKSQKLNDIIRNLKRLRANRIINKNIEKKISAHDFIDKDGANIFEKLIANYDKDVNNKDIPEELTKNFFYNKVKKNNLDPEEELAITLNDKLIFIVLIYCIRLGTLFICYYLINNNLITNINKSLFYYLIYYYVLFVIILLIVNIDTFKLRILFNYMNLHINTTNIWMHALLMGCFIYLIYLLTKNILGDEKPPTELGDHEKIKLKYKLDILTMIIYIFICILIFLI